MNKQQFINKYRRKYYGEKRLGKIYEKSKKYVRLLGKENRKYTTLNNKNELVEKIHTIGFETTKIAKQYLENRRLSELTGYLKASTKNIKDKEQYAKYYVYRHRLGLRKETGTMENFIEKYGTEIYEEKTINQWLNEFKNGKISQDELNKILNEFKKSNQKYLSQNRKNRTQGSD